MLKEYKDVLTVKEVSTILQINRHGVYSLIKSGKLRAFRIEKVYRIPKASTIDYIDHATKTSVFTTSCAQKE